MGCAVSKASEEDEGVLNLCRERKRVMKSAVESRYLLAGAHCKYYQSLYAVALAIRLFVARHSSVSSPFLLTFPRSSEPKGDDNLVPNSMYLQQMPSVPDITHEANSCKTQDSPVSCPSSKPETENQESEIDDDDDDDDEEEQEEERGICEHFYDPPMEMQNDQFGWDYFNPFDGVMREYLVNGFGQTSDEDPLLRVVREAEGIPELEEEGEREVEDVKAVGDANVRQEGLKVVDTPTDGRELLDALNDVEDHFIKAYDSGVEVSKMLETNLVHLQPAMDEIKESSNKLITWNKSTLSRTLSSRSFLSSSSRSSFTWTESSIDLFDEYGTGAGGMESGSHSLTLGRLYAWEKKLYDEVKAGDELRKIYDRKFSQLSNKEYRGDGLGSEDKTTTELRDLYSRISVTLTTAESISKRIQKLRDEELQPQLVELLHGLTRTWKIMLEVHQTQNKTMSEVKFFTCPTLGKFGNDSHRLATLQLEAALQNWRACFAGYVTAQKAYIEALNGWLSMFRAPENESYFGDISVPHCKINAPQLLSICHDWLASMEKLPYEAVAYAMKSFGSDIRALWFQQGVEQQQKRKLDGLARELDNRVVVFKKAEKKILEMKLFEQKVELDVRHRAECLAEKKGVLDMFRSRLNAEKAKHHDSIQETKKVILNGFQTGFSSVLDSMSEFSKASLKMYTELATHGKLLS